MPLDDDELRTSFGKAARARVEQQFTAERMIAETLAVYDEVVAARSGAKRIQRSGNEVLNDADTRAVLGQMLTER